MRPWVVGWPFGGDMVVVAHLEVRRLVERDTGISLLLWEAEELCFCKELVLHLAVALEGLLAQVLWLELERIVVRQSLWVLVVLRLAELVDTTSWNSS